MASVSAVSYASAAQNATQTAKTAPAPNLKAQEAFEGEGKMLLEMYNNYIKNAGGFRMENGHLVHYTTVLHVNKNAQAVVIAMERRLEELGLIHQN